MHFNVLYKRLSILINDTVEEEKPWLHQLSRMIPQTMKDIELKLYKKTISNKVIKFYFNKNNTMEVN